MDRQEIYSAAGLTAYIQEVGFLPLLDSGIRFPMADGTGRCGSGRDPS